MALSMVGIKNIVIVQSKIDVVAQKTAVEHYEQIRKFITGTVAEAAPIIPVSAQKNINLGALVQALDLTIPEPARDPAAAPVMLVARSFDVNKPGSSWKDLKGGVIGGSLIRGVIHESEEIEIRPGLPVEAENRVKWEPVLTSITSIHTGNKRVQEATPGGLLGIGTNLDPALTKSDALAGQVAGRPGQLPPVWDHLSFRVTLMERVVGAESEVSIEPLRHKEPLMLSVGTAVTVGVVTNTKKDSVETMLKRPVCADVGARIAISRQVGGRWRLIGLGVLSE